MVEGMGEWGEGLDIPGRLKRSTKTQELEKRKIHFENKYGSPQLNSR